MATGKSLLVKQGESKPTGSSPPHGPVDNLEEHVPPDWWRFLFNSTYLKTDGDVVDNQQATRHEVDHFVSVLQLQPDAAVLDLCCGQGRHTLELARLGFRRVEGLDRSRYLIHRARRTAKAQGVDVRFREGDARKLPYPPDTFDVVMILGNSFGYFTSVEDDLRVLKEVLRVLKPSGRLLLDVTDGDYMRQHFEPRSWEWTDKHHLVCRERSLSLDEQRLITREIVIHNTKGIVVDQFYAERLYSQEMLERLIASAGFAAVRSHGQFEGQSTRNQDLGMMGHRLLLTGRAKKEWSPVRVSQRASPRKVTVVMGDPRKPDILRPGSIFDEDDFYTIDRLKDALRELAADGYVFTYLDKHDTLVADLLRDRSELVLNLCEEGFDNDARKELHVSALLEVLDVPYTGGTPQCLSTCYDKALVRGIAGDMGIPTPFGYVIRPDEGAYRLPASFPVIVKPTMGDSSFGIRARNVAYDAAALTEVIAELHSTYNRPVLVEEFLTGADLTVGILGNPPDDYQVLPIGVTDYSDLPGDLPPICGYESKWEPDSPYWKYLKFVPASLPEEMQRMITDYSLQLVIRLECRDYCRLDWRCDSQGEPKLLEVNPNPGWCWDGHLNLMAGFGGMSYSEMLKAILRAAEIRHQMKPACVSPSRTARTTDLSVPAPVKPAAL
jgi:D-alanine-D-alanine ligase